jgi:hypothetical protein
MNDLGQYSVLEMMVIETTEVEIGGKGKISGDLERSR